MAVPRTNWTTRLEQLRREAGVYASWQPTPPSVTRQLLAEKDAEAARLAQIPARTPRPTSARERKAKRSAAKAAQNKNGRKRGRTGR
jgi:hypothetical protein